MRMRQRCNSHFQYFYRPFLLPIFLINTLLWTAIAAETRRVIQRPSLSIRQQRVGNGLIDGGNQQTQQTEYYSPYSNNPIPAPYQLHHPNQPPYNNTTNGFNPTAHRHPAALVNGYPTMQGEAWQAPPPPKTTYHLENNKAHSQKRCGFVTVYSMGTPTRHCYGGWRCGCFAAESSDLYHASTPVHHTHHTMPMVRPPIVWGSSRLDGSKRCKRQGGGGCSGDTMYCFPGDTRLMIPSGRLVRMDELELDEWVAATDLTASHPNTNEANSTVASHARVESWIHRAPHVMAPTSRLEGLRPGLHPLLHAPGRRVAPRRTCPAALASAGQLRRGWSAAEEARGHSIVTWMEAY